jgi:large subunit ribosomal protein L6
MSRIGKKPIVIPAGVKVEVQERTVKVKGPRGELVRTFSPEVAIDMENGQIVLQRTSEAPSIRALHGTTRAVLANMVAGVSAGFDKTLQVEGVGYRAEMKGKQLVMSLGFSHPIVVDPPTGVAFAVDEKARTITVTGIDKEIVGQVAANLRAWRPPEPYKGKGLRYVGEQVKRKAGKAGKVG